MANPIWLTSFLSVLRNGVAAQTLFSPRSEIDDERRCEPQTVQDQKFWTGACAQFDYCAYQANQPKNQSEDSFAIHVVTSFQYMKTEKKKGA